MASRKRTAPVPPGSLVELRARFDATGRTDLLEADVQELAAQVGDPTAQQILKFLARELGVVSMGDLLEHDRAQQAVRTAMKAPDRERFLSALSKLAEAEPASTETRRWNARPPADVRKIVAPRDPRDVRAWLEEQGEARLLVQSAGQLYWSVAARFRPAVERLGRETMDDVLAFKPTRAGFRADEIDHLRGAVGAWAESRLRADALAELRERHWSRRRDDPRERVLAVRLQAARRAILEAADDVLTPAEEASVELDKEPPSLHATFRRHVMHSVDARLHLGGFEDGPLRWECRCRGSDGAPCEHVLALVEWGLDALHDDNHPLHRGMLSLVEVPSWRRFLDDLDLRMPAAAAGGRGARVVFRIDPSQQPMAIEAYVQKRGKAGRYSSGRKVRAEQILTKEHDAIAVEDRGCLEALRQQSIAQRHAYATDAASRAALALVGHPRVYLETDPSTRVDVDEVPLTVGFAREPDATGARVQVRVGQLDVRLDAAADETRRVITAFDQDARVVHIARVPREAAALLESVRAYPVLIPETAFDRLITLLLRLQPGVDLRLPGTMRGEEVEPDRRVVARLEPVGDEALRVTLLCRPAPGGSAWRPGEGGRQSYGLLDGRRVFALRDLDGERERATAAAARFGLGDAIEEAEHVFRVIHLDDALELLMRLRDDEAVVVEWPEAALPWQVGAAAGASALTVRVRRAADWFSVDGEVSLDGEEGEDVVQLRALLAAVREGRRFVQLGKGRFARIEADLREKLLALDARVFTSGKGLGVGAASLAALADALDARDADDAAADKAARAAEAAAAPVIDADDQAWRLIQDGLRFARGDYEEPTVPDELQATLREYQLEGFAWLSRLAAWGVGGVLADEMGLGKTVQAIALLLSRKSDGPALIVAPTSVVGNWRAELARFAPSLETRAYHGSRRAQALHDLGPGVVLLTSYDVMARDAEQLAEVPFGVAIYDEAQAIKNPATRRAKAAASLRPRVTIALTGTPLENHLGELWSLMRVVNPGLLGTQRHFRGRFSVPIEREGDESAQESLRKVIQPFLLRRTKHEVAPELPPRTEVVHSVELSEPERRLYEAARRDALGGLAEDGERFEVLAALTRLRRLACHPRLVHRDSTLRGAKLDAFMRLALQLREEGHRALVFSQFTSHLAIVQEALDLARVPTLYLDGSTPQPVREERVIAFQQGSTPFFLISLKAGGTGLNLTAADYVIHLDPWWNPAAEDQASDRAHRIGQDKPVTVVRLVAANTIEEAVLALHEEKRELADKLLAGTGVAGALSTDALRALIAGDG